MRFIRYAFYMIPILWTLFKDLVWEDLSLGEIRFNYLFGKANAYDRADLLRRAIRVYKEILKSEPKSVAVFLNLGGLHYRRAMYETAIPYYEKVIRMNPKHYQGHYWLAMCFWKLERYHAAINTLEEVIQSLPTFKDALNLMGECYERLGEAAKAEHCYLKAISADPNGIIIHGGVLEGWGEEKKKEQRMKH
ncbi:MAG TPA: tetratricopeptide repeat protein [Thermodesulfobacteriota bacterium]|nr:tetratricopeptide repeat protein [Thermodesulfobacteriota bacterium]